MNPRLVFATAGRVLKQLRGDHRTIGMVLVVPCVLLFLFKEVFAEQDSVFQRIGPVMLGVFPFIIMFLVTSVAMVRERTSGTLERLLTTPLAKADLVLGYGLAFGALALFQAAACTTVALALLDLDTPSSVTVMLLVAVADAVLGCALGLCVSALATTEFQAVQFMPAVVLPQILLCGLVAPTDKMAGWLDGVSHAMPLRYAANGMTELRGGGSVPAEAWANLGVVVVIAIGALLVGSATLRRQTA